MLILYTLLLLLCLLSMFVINVCYQCNITYRRSPGVRYPLFTCVNVRDYRPVLHEYCDRVPKPALPTRNCNSGPCPPRYGVRVLIIRGSCLHHSSFVSSSSVVRVFVNRYSCLHHSLFVSSSFVVRIFMVRCSCLRHSLLYFHHSLFVFVALFRCSCSFSLLLFGL